MRQPDPHPLVLMIEDEPVLRLNAAEALQSAGFRFVDAASAGEALHQLRHHADEVAAAIVDLGLPDLRGDELARQLRAIRPALPMVVASGYSRRRLRTLFAGMDGVAFLEKPYGTDELIAAVRALIAGPRSAADPGAESPARAEDPHVVAGE